jgi:hypothetical protein
MLRYFMSISGHTPYKSYNMQEPIYGEEYLCYFNNEYIGSATFTDDPYIGDSFIMWEVHVTQGLREIALMPDSWILKTQQEH